MKSKLKSERVKCKTGGVSGVRRTPVRKHIFAAAAAAKLETLKKCARLSWLAIGGLSNVVTTNKPRIKCAKLAYMHTYL